MAGKRTKKDIDAVEVKDETVLVEGADTVEAVSEVVTVPEAKAKGKQPEKVDQNVVAETVQQLGIFTDYIYNARNYEVDILVENLGYGDAYVSEKGLARVGEMDLRLLTGESKVFKGVSKVYASSASQPVLQILELK